METKPDTTDTEVSSEETSSDVDTTSETSSDIDQPDTDYFDACLPEVPHRGTNPFQTVYRGDGQIIEAAKFGGGVTVRTRSHSTEALLHIPGATLTKLGDGLVKVNK